ncbi:hypothetical protein [Curtobacterium sp. RRHDQ10]|uniref:hypothetical protein n=1 Tax=Curtobacterium phyllosphaerae TaxID=3413379 RepID=UPI003BF26264
MIIELDGLALGTDPGAPLPPVSAIAAPGRIGVVAVETESTPTVASLVAGGRMRPDAGRLLVDGVQDAARVRAHTALVDTPGVAEPFPVMTVVRIVREELALAGLRASRPAVATVVGELGLTGYADTAIERVPTAQRIRLLAELALLRPEVEALVVTSPERHGGSVPAWFAVLQEIADRGIAVVLITSEAAAETVAALVAAAPLPVPVHNGAERDADADGDADAVADTDIDPDADRPLHSPAHRLPEPSVTLDGEPRLQSGPPPTVPTAPSAPTQETHRS